MCVKHTIQTVFSGNALKSSLPKNDPAKPFNMDVRPLSVYYILADGLCCLIGRRSLIVRNFLVGVNSYVLKKKLRVIMISKRSIN